MTLKEMRSCAAETLYYFLEVMPYPPFTADDIVFEFAPKNKMAERAKELCAKYVPEKIINESQVVQLNKSIAANALMGREKSAVIVRINYKDDYHNLKQLLFHELAHIYCGKLEMPESKHFIEVYGSGTSLELLYSRIQREKPWLINEDFITELGEKFLWFRMMNTLFFGGMDIQSMAKLA